MSPPVFRRSPKNTSCCAARVIGCRGSAGSGAVSVWPDGRCRCGCWPCRESPWLLLPGDGLRMTKGRSWLAAAGRRRPGSPRRPVRSAAGSWPDVVAVPCDGDDRQGDVAKPDGTALQARLKCAVRPVGLSDRCRCRLWFPAAGRLDCGRTVCRCSCCLAPGNSRRPARPARQSPVGGVCVSAPLPRCRS